MHKTNGMKAMRLKAQEKMKIQHRVDEYEGIPASNALGMALFESSGMRSLIDKECNYDPEKRILSPGMVVKALIGPTFNITHKFPLNKEEPAYSSTPTDRLFGYGVTKDDFYDNALARGLDTLFDANLQKLFTKCSELAMKRFGFESNVLHMDATDVSFWGVEHEPDKEDAAVPKQNGHPKDHRYELLQYELQIVTDSNRILRYIKPYSGNVADSVMDRNTIEDFERIFSDEERRGMTVVADCKMATADNIIRLSELGMKFVSKCAANFVGNYADRVAEEFVSNPAHPYGDDGCMSEFEYDVALDKSHTEKLRFVAFREEKKVKAKEEKLKDSYRQKCVKLRELLDSQKFVDCEQALEFVRKFESKKDSPIKVKFREPILSKNIGLRGPPMWILDYEILVSDKLIRKKAEKNATVVIVTNLQKPKQNAKNAVNAYTDVEVVGLYNQEYKVEQSFRFMKSGIGMNSIYLQTPSRENAMMFVISIAVLVTNIADAIFRRENMILKKKTMTMYNLAYFVHTTIVHYSRIDNTLSLKGPSEVAKRYFKITDALQINTQYLLGYISE